jgi:PAS domain-containing protein
MDSSGSPASLAGMVWDQVKGYVHDYLNRIIINLLPPVENVKQVLLPLFHEDYKQGARNFLNSMRPGQPLIEPDQVQVDILAEVPVVEQVGEELPDPVAGNEALSRVMSLWQTWDGLLIHMISQFAGQPLTIEEQQSLLDTILSVRYEFEDALAQQQLNTEFIRSQFVWSWQRMEPIFRHHLTDEPSLDLIGFLAFFTAGDALVVLDRAGPALGIEISRDGLYRLAELLSSGPIGTLEEVIHVNPLLREILGLDPHEGENIPEEHSPFNGDDAALPKKPGTSQWNIRDLLTPTAAWAGSFTPPGIEEMRRWASETTSPGSLLGRVRGVLAWAIDQQKGLEKQPQDIAWFETMVTATAWQESCFRQFHIKNNKIKYLLSYNGTSVGLMQINERIWRGMYNRQRLRWDVRYNARAGTEILALYLKRYLADKKSFPAISPNEKKRFLAVWLYALYNGGPSQKKKFPKRYQSKTLHQSEQLFLSKYDQASVKNWVTRVRCL